MAAHVAGDAARIDVVAAAGIGPDGEFDGLAGIEVGGVGAGGADAREGRDAVQARTRFVFISSTPHFFALTGATRVPDAVRQRRSAATTQCSNDAVQQLSILPPP